MSIKTQTKNPNQKPKDYLLKQIDADLHKRIKVAAANEGKSMKEFIIEAIHNSLADI